MASLELSPDVLHGLSLCGDMNDGAFAELSAATFSILLKEVTEEALDATKKLSAVDRAVAKQAYSALCTLVLEMAKHNVDAASAADLLEDCKFSTGKSKSFLGAYTERRARLRQMLGSSSFSYPHVTNVDWRLDYYIKNNHVQRVDLANYLITLKTEESGGAQRDVQFTCTLEQLQDLVNHLKEVSKQIQTMSSAS